MFTFFLLQTAAYTQVIESLQEINTTLRRWNEGLDKINKTQGRDDRDRLLHCGDLGDDVRGLFLLGHSIHPMLSQVDELSSSPAQEYLRGLTGVLRRVNKAIDTSSNPAPMVTSRKVPIYPEKSIGWQDPVLGSAIRRLEYGTRLLHVIRYEPIGDPVSFCKAIANLYPEILKLRLNTPFTQEITAVLNCSRPLIDSFCFNDRGTSGQSPSETVLGDFFKALGECSKLNTLNICMPLNDKDIIPFAQAVGKLINLNHFELISPNTGLEGTQMLADSLGQCKRLRWLTLETKDISASAIGQVASLPRIQSVDLSLGDVSKEKARDIAMALLRAKGITDIRLKIGKITPEAIHILFILLSEKNIVLASSLLGDDVMADLTCLVKQAIDGEHVTTLDLSSKGIKDSALPLIIGVIELLKDLKTVDLSGNELEEDGIEQLLQLSSSKGIKFDVSGNPGQVAMERWERLERGTFKEKPLSDERLTKAKRIFDSTANREKALGHKFNPKRPGKDYTIPERGIVDSMLQFAPTADIDGYLTLLCLFFSTPRAVALIRDILRAEDHGTEPEPETKPEDAS